MKVNPFTARNFELSTRLINQWCSSIVSATQICVPIGDLRLVYWTIATSTTSFD